MTDAFIVRPANVADIDVLARHRAGMFRDMGTLPEDSFDAMCDAARRFYAHAVVEGDYLAWLASPASDSAIVVAGAGLQLRAAQPGVRESSRGFVMSSGLQGIVMNVYTEPAWRRRGLARLLMRYVMDGARAHAVGSLVLHASNEGRPLYETLGFTPTNEMRYTGEL